ncbi:MAG: proline--tRNA ligase [Chloroflexota bacterium]|nr:proline--tRNA ligase [Chloroflexota bacterium]
MRMTNHFGKTLRQIPADADTLSHQLLLRSGMMHQVATGVYAYLPLGWQTLKKIEHIIRDELDHAGGQELLMPALQPYELWEKTERDMAFGKTLFTLVDRKERTLCLGPTHEEVITTLIKYNVQSYRDLPLLPYQIQTKFRDEPRPRGGLLRAREFTMMDLYSFDIDEEAADTSYRKMIQAYNNIYKRCGLPTLMVEADSGAIGGKDSHEFMVITPSGEDEVISCSHCDYAANMEKAQSIKPKQPTGDPLPIEEVHTPGKKTIEEVASLLQVPHSQTLKAVFYSADGQIVFVAIRGDLEVNEIKLKNALKCFDLHLADEEEVAAAGLVAGSASPLGLTEIKTIGDDSITMGSNFVAGANKADYHLKNVNYPRDFQIDELLDIATAQPGHECPRCGKHLTSTRGVEVGHIFKLGTVFSKKLGALFLDKDGEHRPIIMGCYGIGVGRLLAAAVEQNHDDKGIIWPMPITPHHVYLCTLGADNEDVTQVADKLYKKLQSASLSVLFDDRSESPGVKLNDADLLGIPLRVVISTRTLKQQSVEIKLRKEKDGQLIPIDNAAKTIKELVKDWS